MNINFTPIQQVIDRFKAGEMVIVCDDQDRENEGDICVAVESLTAEQLSFMMQHARGLICVSLSQNIAQKLNLPFQVVQNNSSFLTPFAPSLTHVNYSEQHQSVEARLYTLKRLIADVVKPEEFMSPGSVYPLIAKPQGVIARNGQTEGSYDLARIAGCKEAVIICEILNEDGTMSRGDDLNRYALKHNMVMTSVAEILSYRIKSATLLRYSDFGIRETAFGRARIELFYDDIEQKEHLALTFGDISRGKDVLTRIHSECLTGDVFGSERCDCGPQLSESLNLIKKEGSGVLLYLRQEGRGIGLSNKLKAYHLQDMGRDTVQANLDLGFAPDLRDFKIVATILKELGISSIRLLTNNPDKLSSLESTNIEVIERIPLIIPASPHSACYLQTKKDKLGHLL